MRGIEFFAAAAVAATCFTAVIPRAQAGVSVDIGVAPAAVGVAPECPYGYYDVPPYACAPAGYYGPEWFTGGVFIGAGPWFHGPDHFHGRVNNEFHPDHGYRGPMPHRGDRADPGRRVDAAHFRGNEQRDGRGHVAEGRR
jgi:hypothetical protein